MHINKKPLTKQIADFIPKELHDKKNNANGVVTKVDPSSGTSAHGCAFMVKMKKVFEGKGKEMRDYFKRHGMSLGRS